MVDGLKTVQQDNPIIGDIRGSGLLIAAELVKDRTTKEPAADETVAVFELTRKHGLVTSKAGPHRSVLRLVPPMCLSERDVPIIVGAMARSFSELIDRTQSPKKNPPIMRSGCKVNVPAMTVPIKHPIIADKWARLLPRRIM